MDPEEISVGAKAILHESIDAVLMDLLYAKLDAKLDAMTALELSDFINKREAQRKK